MPGTLRLPSVPGIPGDKGRGGGSGRQVELEQDVGDVPLYRMFAEAQLHSHLGIGAPARKQSQNLAFSLG